MKFWIDADDVRSMCCRLRLDKGKSWLDKMKFWIEEQVGKLLFSLRFKPRSSTGIGGDHTMGYGRLSGNGYWQFPAPRKAFADFESRQHVVFLSDLWWEMVDGLVENGFSKMEAYHIVANFFKRFKPLPYNQRLKLHEGKISRPHGGSSDET